MGIIRDGEIVNRLPAGRFTVKINGLVGDVVCTVSEISMVTGAYKRLIPGDKVRVELSKKNMNTGEIIII